MKSKCAKLAGGVAACQLFGSRVTPAWWEHLRGNRTGGGYPHAELFARVYAQLRQMAPLRC